MWRRGLSDARRSWLYSGAGALVLLAAVAASMTRLAPWPVSHPTPTSYVIWGESASPVAATQLHPRDDGAPEGKSVGAETRPPGLSSGPLLTALAVIAGCLACVVAGLNWGRRLGRRRRGPHEPALVSRGGSRDSELGRLRSEASCLPSGNATAAGELIKQAWRSVERAGAEAGVARDSVETPREYAGRLARSLAMSEPDLARLQVLYSSVTYGRWAPSDHEIANARELISRLVTEVVARDAA